MSIWIGLFMGVTFFSATFLIFLESATYQNAFTVSSTGLVYYGVLFVYTLLGLQYIFIRYLVTSLVSKSACHYRRDTTLPAILQLYTPPNNSLCAVYTVEYHVLRTYSVQRTSYSTQHIA